MRILRCSGENPRCRVLGEGMNRCVIARAKPERHVLGGLPDGLDPGSTRLLQPLVQCLQFEVEPCRGRLLDGDPFSALTRVRRVMLEGKEVYRDP